MKGILINKEGIWFVKYPLVSQQWVLMDLGKPKEPFKELTENIVTEYGEVKVYHELNEDKFYHIGAEVYFTIISPSHMSFWDAVDSVNCAIINLIKSKKKL